MVFDNEAQLKSFLLTMAGSAVDKVYNDVCEIIDKCIRTFYGEFNPESYIRTKELVKSFVKKGVVQQGNEIVGEVYFDAGQMFHQMGLIETKKDYMGYATWDEEKIMKVALTGSKPHGGYATGTPIWNESEAIISSLGGIIAMLLRELKAVGIPIK